jgi:hypothetical protein
MADLNITNLSKNSDKYIFKKKLTLKRKSIRRLFIESALMFILSMFLIYINYSIPNKNLLLKNLPVTINKFFNSILELFTFLGEIFLVFFIFVSLFISLILLIGSFYRIFRIANRKTKSINYR